MSAGEIGTRLRDAMRQRRERRLHGQAAVRFAVSEQGQHILADIAAILPGASRHQLHRLKEDLPCLHGKIRTHAQATSEAIVSGSWEMLGHTFDLSGDVDWHCDPRTEHRFPHLFYADVQLHQDADDDVDVKYVWELGRHQYLPELARGWRFSGNEHSAEHARRLLLSWIDQNPIYEGVHWTSGLEVAVRAISWIWTLATLAEWDGWQERDLDRIATSLTEHGTYLEHHFSFYSSPYNHLVGEATGLYLISQALRQHPNAEAWRRKSRQVLEEHGPKQFYDDGFCVEQATGYHFFSLGFLTMAIVAARQEGMPLERVEPAVHRAFRTGILFQQPDGRWPAIGDVDSARAIPVHHDDFWDFGSLCSLGGVLFGDPQLKRPDSQPGEELYWLLGGDGIDHFNTIETTQPDGFTHLPESGYAIARQGGDWLCLDAGPVGHGLHADGTPSTAHGHLDTLQVLYCQGSRPVLIDPGMPFYFGDREWVRHFRSPVAHNTLEIDGLPLAQDAGRLEWSHVKPRPELLAENADGIWMARARIAWATGITLERYVACVPGFGLWVADVIELDRPRH
ncbi:MAG: heparinase II/III family protein, partial [Planctomycetaceae bacterium]